MCQHSDRQKIDLAVVAGEAKRGIARRFAVSPDAVERHAKAHVGAAIVRAADRRGEKFDETILQKITGLEADARRLGVRERERQILAGHPRFSELFPEAQEAATA